MEILFQQPMFWNAEKLEELFNTLNPKRKLRLQREKLAKENQQK